MQAMGRGAGAREPRRAFRSPRIKSAAGSGSPTPPPVKSKWRAGGSVGGRYPTTDNISKKSFFLSLAEGRGPKTLTTNDDPMTTNDNKLTTVLTADDIRLTWYPSGRWP
jgi:hypothetical protein